MVRHSDACYPGIDYFVFPKDLWGTIPPFALGRAYWDNWLLYAARRRRAVVVDATPVVLAVHQEHAYFDNQLQGAESRRNWDLVGDACRLLTTREADARADRGRHQGTLSVVLSVLHVRPVVRRAS
jgi:hypothetical protein